MKNDIDYEQREGADFIVLVSTSTTDEKRDAQPEGGSKCPSWCSW